jgi:hypothetical protein
MNFSKQTIHNEHSLNRHFQIVNKMIQYVLLRERLTEKNVQARKLNMSPVVAQES